MAHAFTVTTVLDTPNVAVLHVFIDGDSTDATEITSADTDIIFDASALSGANNAARILSVVGSLNGFSATLKFDGATPFSAVVLPKDADIAFDFGERNTISNNATTPNGDIIIETQGLASSNNYGFFVIRVRKAQ